MLESKQPEDIQTESPNAYLKGLAGYIKDTTQIIYVVPSAFLTLLLLLLLSLLTMLLQLYHFTYIPHTHIRAHSCMHIHNAFDACAYSYKLCSIYI